MVLYYREVILMNIDLIYHRLKKEEDRITADIGNDSWKKDSDLKDLTFQPSSILKRFINHCSKEYNLSKEDEAVILSVIKTKDAFDELDQETKINYCIATIKDILNNKSDLKEILKDSDKNMIISMISSINHMSVASIARFIALGSMNVKDTKDVLNEVKHYKRDITNRLNECRIELEKKYGDEWIVNFDKEEEEKYINLYCKVYDISRDDSYKELKKRQSIYKNKNLKNEANKMLNLEALNQYRVFLEKKYGDRWNDLMSLKERKDFTSLYVKVYPVSKNKVNENMAEKSNNNFDELNKFRIMLENKYKNNWLGSMTKKEKSIFVDLYSKAYNVDSLKVKEGFNKTKKKRKVNELNDFIDDLFNKYGNDWSSLLNSEEKEQFVVVYANEYKVSKEQAEEVVVNIFSKQNKNRKNYETLIIEERDEVINKLSEIALKRDRLSKQQKEEFNYLMNELTSINSIPIIKASDIQKKYKAMQKLNRESDKFYEYIGHNYKER